MINNLRNNKGITLIALVITIIVLLILAGVAISMLAGDNGILRQATTAKKNSETQSIIERIKLAATGAMTNTKHKVNEGELNNELTRYFGKKGEGYEIDGNETSGWTVTVGDIIYYIDSNGKVIPVVTEPPTTKVSEKTKYKDETSLNTTTKTAVIPEGFRVSEIEDEQKIDTGLVVIAPDGSQFVWVPVDDVSKMYGIRKVAQDDGKIKDVKTGKLYSFTDSNVSNNKEFGWKETDGVMSWTAEMKYREPDKLGETDASTEGINLLAEKVTKIKELVEQESLDLNTEAGQTAVLNAWKVQLQSEFEEMITSVGENGGFYVGRYETSTNAKKNKPQSVANEPSTTGSTNSNTWYGLYQLQKEYSEKNGLRDVVRSSMIWGSQYDQMMIWMQKNGYNVVSNESNQLKGAVYNDTQTTGKEDDLDVINNVYDLIGCNFEWTLESFLGRGRSHRRWLFGKCWTVRSLPN